MKRRLLALASVFIASAIITFGGFSNAKAARIQDRPDTLFYRVSNTAPGL